MCSERLWGQSVYRNGPKEALQGERMSLILSLVRIERIHGSLVTSVRDVVSKYSTHKIMHKQRR